MIIHEGRQIVTKPENIELELVPLSDRLREVHHKELGLGTELHASSPEVVDVITVQMKLKPE